MVPFLDFGDVFAVDFMFFVFSFMIFFDVFLNFVVSQEKRLVDLFAIEMIEFLQFSEESILIMGSVDGELDLIEIVFGNLLNVHGFVRVGGQRKVLMEGLLELLSLFENTLGRGGFEFGEGHR